MTETPLNNPETPETDSHSAAKDINWSDFRDHLATADKEGHRRWIYPKKVGGRFYNARTYVSWLLLTIMFTGPFIRINGNPLLMINILERRFSILGQIFWPQDVAIFAVAMLLFLTGILIFTTAFGRLWCGWTCPQTLLMEMVFRKIEYAIEGDSLAQRALAAAPWGYTKAVKRILKHTIFLSLSFVIGNTLLSYIIGSDALIHIVRADPREHIAGLVSMVLFTLLFYAIFARFREQACTFICPYGRFQSAILDENTLVVAYDYKRGEKRGHLQKAQTNAGRKSSGLGDCVSCNQCVSVCPTGIDIRDGTQMECVNCTACIDACDAVMAKVNLPSGLIRYASLNSIERGEKFKITPRLIGYGLVLTALIALFIFLVFSRSIVEATLFRTPGALFQTAADGNIEDLYNLELINKTSHEIPVELKLENMPGKISLMLGQAMVVPKDQLASTSVLIEIPPSALHEQNTDLEIGVYSQGKRIQTIHTIFTGPRPPTPKETP